jgi:hypothetical protein
MTEPTEKDAERFKVDAAQLPGLELALAMLKEMEDADCEFSRYGLEPRYRQPGKEQDNIVLRYLDGIRGDRALEEGFTSLLSEYISSCIEGGVPGCQFYLDLIEKTGARKGLEGDHETGVGCVR